MEGTFAKNTTDKARLAREGVFGEARPFAQHRGCDTSLPQDDPTEFV